jgi:hypothetical protein
MSQSLEDTLRDLAKRGEISHISVAPSQNGKKFRASFTCCSKFGISFAEDDDPAKAIMLACTTAKMKPQRAEKKPHVMEHSSAPATSEESIEDLM